MLFKTHPIRLDVLALCTLSGVASAQDSAPATPPATPNNELERVIVTSQKRSEDVKRVPLSVTAISGEALKDNQITNFTDISRPVRTTPSCNSPISSRSTRRITSGLGRMA